MLQCVRDPALSLEQFGSLLWHRFEPWPWNFHMSQAWPKRKKKMVPTFQMVEAEKYLPLIVLSVYSVFLIFEGDVIGSLIFISLILVG